MLARECPAKLFYAGKKEYPDKKDEDSFLEALADGGFQVGALARLYFPEGLKNDIDALDYDKALQRTVRLLQHDKVTIFEAAFRCKNIFLRADILVKNGNDVRLIEVKAKSFSGDESDLLSKKGDAVSSEFRSYIEDVAFQKYVVSRAYPEFRVKAYLMLADKSRFTTVDGLNQFFKVKKEGDRKKVAPDMEKIKANGLGEEILTLLCVDDAIEMIYQEEDDAGRTFIGQIHFFADHYEQDKKIITPIGTQCKSCEFVATPEQEKAGLKSGFKECWKEQLKWQDSDFEKPHVFEIWNYRQAQQRIAEGRHFMHELKEDDFSIKPSAAGLSAGERQWLQVRKTVTNNTAPHLDRNGLRKEMRSWNFPLHFIDFETTQPAIPFYKNMRPYEGIVFQYSHHTVQKNGTIEHAGQYLNTQVGCFPNFDFIRSLKRELEQDDGTIFRYAAHENTYLNIVHSQLEKSKEPDRMELMGFIETITSSTASSAKTWEGGRSMTDMLDLVKRYFYQLGMKGSNSIKAVLPAVLNSSAFLKKKYAQPIYGSEKGIKSFNFRNHAWIEYAADGKTVKDPYELLPPIFQDTALNEEVMRFIEQHELEELRDGGAAMMAYNLIQFTEGFVTVNEALKSALLKYCELDTMAMVMIWEGWREWVE